MAVLTTTLQLKDKMSTGLTAISRKVASLKNGLAAIGNSTQSLTKVGGSGGFFTKIGIGAKGISANVSAANKGFGKFNTTLKTTVGLIAGLSAARKVISDVASSIGDATDRLDVMTSFRRKMTLITGDEKNADKALEALKESTKGTPYKLPTATMGVQNFVLRGLSTDEAVESVNTWMDAVSAYGMGTSEELQTVLDALGKMRTKGTVEMKQLNRLFNVGINPVEMYAKAVGAATSDVSKALSNREITSDTFIKVVEKAMKEGIGGVTVISGQAKKAATTWKATLDNMQAAITRGVTEIIEALDGMFKPLNDKGLKGLFKQYGDTVEAGLGKAADFITGTVTPAFAGLVKAYQNVKKSFSEGVGLDFYKTNLQVFKNRQGLFPKLDLKSMLGGQDLGGLTSALKGFQNYTMPVSFVEFLKLLEALSEAARTAWPQIVRLGSAFAQAFLEITGENLPDTLRLMTREVKKFSGYLSKNLPKAVDKVLPHVKEILQTFLAFKTIGFVSGTLAKIMGVIGRLIPFAGNLKLGLILLAASFGLVKLSGGTLTGLLDKLSSGFQKVRDKLQPAIDAFNILKDGLIDSVTEQFTRLWDGLSGTFGFDEIEPGSFLDTLRQKFDEFLAGLPDGAREAVETFDDALGGGVTTVLDIADYIKTGEVDEDSSPVVVYLDRAIQKFNEFKEAVSPVVSEVSQKFTELKDTIGPIISDISQRFEELKAQVSPVLEEVWSNVSRLSGPLSGLAASAWDFIQTLAQIFVPPAMSILGDVTETLKDYLPTVSALMADFGSAASTALTWVMDKLTELAGIVFPPVLDKLKEFAEWMKEHPEEVSRGIGAIVSAAVGFVVFKSVPGWIGTATTAFTALKGGIGALSGAFTGAVGFITGAIGILKGGGGIAGLVSAFASLASPVTWIALIIGAISALAVYLVYLYHTSDDFKQKWDAAWNMDDGIGGGLWSLVSVLSIIVRSIKIFWAVLVNTGKIIVSAVKMIWTPIKWLLEKIGAVYDNTVGKVGGWVGEKIGAMFGWDMSKKDGDGLFAGLGDGFDDMEAKVNSFGDEISGLIDDKNAEWKADLYGEETAKVNEAKKSLTTPADEKKKSSKTEEPTLPETELGALDVQAILDEITGSEAATNATNNIKAIADSFSGSLEEAKDSMGYAKDNLYDFGEETGLNVPANNLKAIAESFSGSGDEAKSSFDTAKKNVKDFGETITQILGKARGALTGERFVDGFVNALGGGVTQEAQDKFVADLSERLDSAKEKLGEIHGGTLEGIRNGGKDPQTMLTKENLDKAKEAGKKALDSRHEPLLTKDNLKKAGDWISEGFKEGQENRLESIRNGSKTAKAQTAEVKPKTAYANNTAELKTLKPKTSQTKKGVDWRAAERLKALQSDLAAKVSDIYQDVSKSGGQISSNLMAGLLKGLNSSQNRVSEGYDDFIDSLKRQFTDGFEIHSPSRFTQYISSMLSKGMERGWTQRKLNVYYDKAIADLKRQIQKGAFDEMQWMRQYDRDVMIGILGRISDLDDTMLTSGERKGFTFPFTAVPREKYPKRNGIDFEVRDGAQVLSALGGKVTSEMEDYNGYGKALWIEHENGLKTLYAGLRSSSVHGGSEVIGGREIGRAGYSEWDKSKKATKRMFFGVMKGGKMVDPNPYLKDSGHYSKGAYTWLSRIRAAYRHDYGTYPNRHQRYFEEKYKKGYSIGVGDSEKGKEAGYKKGLGFFQRQLSRFGYSASGDKAAFLSKWANTLSGLDPEAQDTTYSGASTKGLFQLTDQLFRRYGGNSKRDTNIWNPVDNTLAALKFLNDFKKKYKIYVQDAKRHKFKDSTSSTRIDSFNDVVDLFTSFGYNYYTDQSRFGSRTKSVGGIRSDAYWRGEALDDVKKELRYNPKNKERASGQSGQGKKSNPLGKTLSAVNNFLTYFSNRGPDREITGLPSTETFGGLSAETVEALEDEMPNSVWQDAVVVDDEVADVVFSHPDVISSVSEFEMWKNGEFWKTSQGFKNAILRVIDKVTNMAKNYGDIKEKGVSYAKKVASGLVGKFAIKVGTNPNTPEWLVNVMRKVYDKAKDVYLNVGKDPGLADNVKRGMVNSKLMTKVGSSAVSQIIAEMNQQQDLGYKMLGDLNGFGGTIDSMWWRMAQDYSTGALNTMKNKDYVTRKPSKGYATGTGWARRGLHWVGEEGPELMSFRGGETVIPHDESVNLAQAAARRRNGSSGLDASALTGAATGSAGAKMSSSDERSYSVGNNNTFNISSEVDADRFLNQFEEQMHRVLSDGTRIMTGV